MSSVREVEVFHLTDVVDYLGPAEGRFFGTGYKRPHHQLSGIRVDFRDESPSFTARCGVTYPTDWSRKAGRDQEPHLSTVDVLLFSVQAAEVLLLATFGLTEEDRRGAWVRSIVIKAGRTPVEGELSDLPVTAELLRTQEEDGDVVSTVRSTVASLSAELDIVHRPRARVATVVDGASGEQLLGPSVLREYGDGYKDHVVRIADVHIDLPRAGATAQSTINVGGSEEVAVGLEADFGPSVSLVDAFVEALQLGQILIYEMDGLDRGNSNTLWMRRTVIRAGRPDRPVAAAGRTDVELRNSRIVSMGQRNWRTCDIVATRPGLSVQCSVGHALPGDLEDGER